MRGGSQEFITGRDIFGFGNLISEEEQQAGFERALLFLPFKGKPANPVLGVKSDARVVSNGNSSIIPINPNTIPSGVNRTEFNKWRTKYWKNRSNDVYFKGG